MISKSDKQLGRLATIPLKHGSKEARKHGSANDVEASRSGGVSGSTFYTIAVSSRVTNRRQVRGLFKGAA
ncbi:hypothetical protein BK140_31755 [Paenibacillus macerans]|nr:hypothetical protein BK140_31755 [Paenibacillus macerans]